jgi:hypothetical protein
VFVWSGKGSGNQIIGRHLGFVRDLCSAVCGSSRDVALNDNVISGYLINSKAAILS